MKSVLLSLSIALIALAPAQAQMLRPGASDRSPRTRSDSGSQRGHGGATAHRPTVHGGIGHQHGHGRGSVRHGGGWHYGPYRTLGFGYYSPYRVVPSYGYYDGYGYDYPYYNGYGYYGSSASGAANGLLLGALAGGIIGHNSGGFGHNGWRGAAWGAGVGWLLGSVADAHRRVAVNQRAPIVVQQPVPTPVTQPAATQSPQQVTIINNYYSASPMSGANSLFGR